MKNNRRPLAILASGVGIGLALTALGAMSASATRAQQRTRIRTQSASLSGPSSVKVRYGQPIPEFVLTNAATGKNVGFGTFSAGKKATVIVFMSTHCPVSNAYEGRIQQIATKYAAQGVQVAGIFPNVGEEMQEVADHAKEKGLTFLCLRDETAKEAKQFTATVTPEVYVADAKGVLVYHGPVDDSQDPSGVTHAYVTDTLDAVLAGKPAPVKTRRAFGCQIHLPDAK